ncbi:peptidoglycan hydrolase-like protein with peptidoglycan-binding domain [Amorphus suaedae]
MRTDMCFARCSFHTSPFSNIAKFGIVLVSLQVGFSIPSHANDDLLRSILGLGSAVVQNEINRQQAYPARGQPIKVSEPRLTPDQIFALQIRLNALGYDTGTPDGGLGRNTRQGIRQWQKATGQPATGYLTNEQASTLLQGADAAIRAAANRDGQLLPSEVQQLQRRLNELGYDVGEPDGVAGPRTDRALSQFLRDQGRDPKTVSARSALSLASAGGSEPAPQATPLNAGAGQGVRVANVDVSGIEFERLVLDRGNANRQLIRMMVAARPQVLDNKDNLSRLFRIEGNRHGSTYRVDEDLDKFKAEYLASPVPESANVTLVDSYTLERSAYSREKGIFPFRSYSMVTEGLANYTSIDGGPIRGSAINLHIPDLPALSGIPMTLEEAESFERKFGYAEAYFISVEAQVQIYDLKYNPERRLFEAEARLFSIEARSLGKRREAEPIFVWPLENRATSAVSQGDPPQVMGTTGAEVPGVVETNGHIDLARLSDVGGLAASLMLASYPSAIDDDLLLAAAGKALLSRAEQLEIWRGNEPDEWGRGRLRDEELQSISYFASEIRKRFINSLSVKVIDPNIKIVEKINVRLGDPDAPGDAIPLNYEYKQPALIRDTYDFAEIRWGHSGVVLPRKLPLDGGLSRALIERWGNKLAGQELYLAIYSDVSGVAAEPFDTRSGFYSVELTPIVTRIALYFDDGLEDLAYDFYEGSDGYLLSEQREQSRISSLLSEKRTGVDALHSLYGQLSADDGYLTELIVGVIRQESVNEFARAKAERELMNALEAAGDSANIVFDWEMKLGRYDMARNAFAVIGSDDGSDAGSLTFSESDQGLGLESLTVDIVNQPKWLEVSRSAAQQFVERFEAEDRRRVVRAVVNADAVSAKVTADRHDRVHHHLGVYVRQMVLLARDSTSLTGYEILGEVDYGPYRASEIVDVEVAGNWGPSPQLDQEMAAILSLRIGNDGFTDSDLRRLYADRWLREQERGFPASSAASIFNGGGQVPTISDFEKSRSSFLQWMEMQAQAELPEVAQIRMALPGWGGQQLRAGQCSDMRAVTGGSDAGDIAAVKSALGISLWDYENELRKQMGRGAADKPAVLENVMFTFVYPSITDCAVPEAVDVARSVSGGRDATRHVAYLLVDRLPIPRNYVEEGYSYGTVEFTIEEVSPLRTDDGVSGVIVRGSFRDVSYTKEDDRSENASANGLRWSTDDIVRESIDLDILGLRLGMAEAEADKLAREYLGEDVIVLKSRPDQSPAVPAFTDTVFYLKADLRERVALFYEEGKGSRDVLAIQRIVSSPNWALPRDQVAKGLIAKYGEPIHAEYGQYQTMLAWGPGAGTYECQRFDNGGGLVENWVDQKGDSVSITDFMDWNLARDSTMAYVPEPFTPESTKHCLGILLADQNSNRLSMLLVDPAEYISAWRRTQALNEPGRNAPTAAAGSSGGTSLGIRF